jgi:hypothetical protein
VRRRTALAGALLVALGVNVGVEGCVQLPHGGPVKSVSVEDDADGDTLVDYTPAGPKKGTAPIPLVDNFLTSMTATPLNTRVAREFLTSSSRDRWVPERGTVVYGNQQIVSRGRGRLVLRLRDVVELDGRGAWRGDPTGGHGHDYRLRLVKQDGQWRIDRPPDRLLIPRAHFDTQYQQFLMYFVAKGARVLVPEPVYVPRGRQAPTLLVASLLKGPRPDLGAERTLVPKGTSLDGISVPVSREGTAEVPLSDQVLDLGDDQLSTVYAQLSWTLGQVPGVRRVRVTVDGAPVELPGSRGDVAVDGWSVYDPAVSWASASLFGLRSGRLVAIGSGGEENVTGPFGVLRLGLRSIAVDMLGQQVAGVTADGRRVLEGNRDGVAGRRPTRGDVRTVFAGRDVLQPAYDLYGQLWVVDRADSGARLSVVQRGTARPVTAPGLTGADVRRFVLSRDGTRLVTQVRRDGRDELLVARVRRDSEGRVRGVDQPKALAVSGGPDRIRDIAMSSPATVAVLSGPTGGSSQIVAVKVDGSTSGTTPTAAPQIFAHRATELVASPDPATSLFLQSPSGRLYTLSHTGRWHPSAIESGLRAVTYVG